MANPLIAVVLAAGEGTRMNSNSPKVLLPVAGRPMLDYVLEAASAAGAFKTFLVVGDQAEKVTAHAGKRAQPVLQKKRLGTGHAVQQALPRFKSFKGNVLVLYGDACLLRPQTVMALRQFHQFQGSSATLLTALVQDPFGYGRIVRDSRGGIERIVEERDADDEKRKVREVNAGVCLFKASLLAQALQKLRPGNSRGEFYLTDTVRWLVSQGEKVESLTVPDASEVLGINDQKQLTQAHHILNLRRMAEHQRDGVTFLNPKTTEVGPEVHIGRDSIVEGNVWLEGKTEVGDACRIESGSRLRDARLGSQVTVRSSRILESEIGEGSDVGPFAHVRPGCEIAPSVHIGTNAELKNARVGSGTSVGHFSYVGDATLGKNVNVGAGCVFANYDGKRKHECHVGDKAFLGSNSTLVAPVNIGKGAAVGAGAVVTRDVPAGTTVVGVPARPLKKK